MHSVQLRNPSDTSQLDPQLRWFCEPSRWCLLPDGQQLRIEPDAGTDFWQKTHYGFEADNGHFLYADVDGDFTMTTHVAFHPVHQYDQAGLMVRLSHDCWLKTSIEFEPDEPSRLGAVVTNHGYSDWSTQSVATGTGSVWLQVQRDGDNYLVRSSWDGQRWEQIRLAHLHRLATGGTIACGLYACSPKGAGFTADFRAFCIEAKAS